MPAGLTSQTAPFAQVLDSGKALASFRELENGVLGVHRVSVHRRSLGHGQIVEENLFYDLVTSIEQIGLAD